MQLTLVLPNLLDVEPDALAAVEAPALARLLATAAAPAVEPGGTIAFACAAVGIAKQHDWPVAPWLARAAGIDPGNRYWLCAEPLTFQLERDRGRLTGIVSDLEAGESASLLSSLRAHFAPDGMAFVEGGPGRWWAALEKEQRLQTSAPSAALGRPIMAHLPRGADAGRWRRWQSEMQMLLFEHPVNRSRESDGRLAVNYVWMWGGGTLREANPDATAEALFTKDPLLRALARAAGRGVENVPASLAAFRASPTAASALVWLEDLESPDLREQLGAFDSHWAAPLERALDRREIDATLVIGGSATAISFIPRATGAVQRLWRRWSPAPALPSLLTPHADG
jgi:hypothetical protein